MTDHLQKLLADVREQAHLFPSLFRGKAGLQHQALALCEEAGEVAGVVVKACRESPDSDQLSAEASQALALELGDVLWRLVSLCDRLGFPLDAIAQLNQEKLEARRKGETLPPPNLEYIRKI